MGFPLSRMVTPPALPRRTTTVLFASMVRVSFAAKVPEKELLPSERMEIQAGSAAVTWTCTAPGVEAVSVAAGGVVCGAALGTGVPGVGAPGAGVAGTGAAAAAVLPVSAAAVGELEDGAGGSGIGGLAVAVSAPVAGLPAGASAVCCEAVGAGGCTAGAFCAAAGGLTGTGAVRCRCHHEYTSEQPTITTTTTANAGSEAVQRDGASPTASHSFMRGKGISTSPRAVSPCTGAEGWGSSMRCSSPVISSSSRPRKWAYWRTKLLVKTPPGSLSKRSVSIASKSRDEIFSSLETRSNVRFRFTRSPRRVSPSEVIT